MSDLPPDPRVRVFFNPRPMLRGFGCFGCLIALFIVGGIVGLLVLGWKALLAG